MSQCAGVGDVGGWSHTEIDSNAYTSAVVDLELKQTSLVDSTKSQCVSRVEEICE